MVAGYEDLTTECGLPENAPIVGFKATTPNDGPPAHGKGIVVGDAIYDAEDRSYTGEQWTLWLSGKASKQKHGVFTGPYGRMGFVGSYTGTVFGDNYGYLVAGPPEKGEVAGHGTTTGKLSKKLRK